MPSLSGQELAAGPDPPVAAPAGERFTDSDISLATRTARGSIVTASFLAAINVLGLVKGLVGASFLGPAAYGLWGLIGVTTGLVFWLGAVGVDDKYIQQDHPDQEAAFQVAFTLQCGLAAILAAGIAVAMPLLSLAYDAPEIVAPGMVLALTMPALALQTPLWVFWRRMDFVRQRRLQIWDPIVSLVAVVALAVAGLDVWAMVLGSIAGAYAAAIAAVRASPYPLRLRYERGALREYASFSWPLFVGSAGTVLIGLVPALVASRALGVAAVGAITLANTIAQFAYRVDEVLTQVIYPAICAVKDRRDLLFAAFSKSNRLALLWALPCGAAVALFAGDFVDHVIGERWGFAVTLIQIVGVTAAVNQIGFNWSAFYRALDRTRPVAVANMVLLAGVLGAAVPLLVAEGVNGYAAGMAVATLMFLGARLYYLGRIFPALRVIVHVGGAAAPTIPAVLAVLAIRAVAGGGRPLGQVALEAGVFVIVTALATAVLERGFLRELRAYLRGDPPPP
jgi:PST family polysaccharide transporter